jgi:hypothetical protein
LRVAKVHHLVQKLVYNNEIVADGFFFESLEVLCEYLNDFVEEEEDLGSICVALGEGEDVEVVVANIEVLSRGTCQLVPV